MRNIPAPRELLRIQMTMQRIDVYAAGRLVRIPGPDPDGIPRYHGACYDDGGCDRFFAATVPARLLDSLRMLPLSTAFDEPDAVARFLAHYAPVKGIWIASSSVARQPFSPADYPDVTRLATVPVGLVAPFDSDLVGMHLTGAVIMRDGQIVSRCVSSRESELAGEAWVRTLPTYQGNGFMSQVVAAWASALMCAGKLRSTVFIARTWRPRESPGGWDSCPICAMLVTSRGASVARAGFDEGMEQALARLIRIIELFGVVLDRERERLSDQFDRFRHTIR